MVLNLYYTHDSWVLAYVCSFPEKGAQEISDQRIKKNEGKRQRKMPEVSKKAPVELSFGSSRLKFLGESQHQCSLISTVLKNGNKNPIAEILKISLISVKFQVQIE